tara:strand:- start:1100 stop:1675 length:576 start_codon:yes stop_codon:yes gene_type:complete
MQPESEMPRRLGLLALPLSVLGASSFGETVVDAFIETLDERAGIVVDIGANDGSWSKFVMQKAVRAGRSNLRFIMVEPNPRFTSSLHTLADRYSGSSVIAAAAWTSPGSMTFHFAGMSESSSLLKPGAGRPGTTNMVPTIDLATSLASLLPSESSHAVLLKCDTQRRTPRTCQHALRKCDRPTIVQWCAHL